MHKFGLAILIFFWTFSKIHQDSGIQWTDHSPPKCNSFATSGLISRSLNRGKTSLSPLRLDIMSPFPA